MLQDPNYLSFPPTASPSKVKEATKHRRIFLLVFILAETVQATLPALGQLCNNVHTGVILYKGLTTLLQLLEFGWVCQN